MRPRQDNQSRKSVNSSLSRRTKTETNPALLTIPVYPNFDILNENVKSGFALGHLRGRPVIKRGSATFQKSEIQQKRDQTYGQVNIKSKNKRLTLLKFGFRTHEKKNNYYLMPLIRKVKEAYGDSAIDGSMGVVDLWSDRNVNRLMEAIEMTRDNLLLRRMGQEKQSDVDPVLLTRQEEKKLQARIYMESLKIQQIDTDTFAEKFQLTRKEQQRLDRISQPTECRIINNSQSNTNIQSIIQSTIQLHDENLQLYKEIHKEIKSLRNKIK